MRKLLSGLLVLVMLVALLPVTALAAQEVGLVEADAVLENGTVVSDSHRSWRKPPAAG
ncbi:MAG: hypothetical protein ACLU9S_07595 [Oscillospiraceae bacterium]